MGSNFFFTNAFSKWLRPENFKENLPKGIEEKIRIEISIPNKYFNEASPNPYHNLRHINDVVRLANHVSDYEPLTPLGKVALKIAAWCHDLRHTGKKDLNIEPLVRHLISDELERGKKLSIIDAIKEVASTLGISSVQENEFYNIKFASLAFIEVVGNIPELNEYFMNNRQARDLVVEIIMESSHPKFYDPKTGDFWVPQFHGQIFRDIDALATFVAFKYPEEGEVVFFKKIIQKEKETNIFERSWFEQVIGIYVEEKFSGNTILYREVIRLENETLEDYISRIINNPKIKGLVNIGQRDVQITNGRDFLLEVIRFERSYLTQINQGNIPIRTKTGRGFYKQVKNAVMEDLIDIEAYIQPLD